MTMREQRTRSRRSYPTNNISKNVKLSECKKIMTFQTTGTKKFISFILFLKRLLEDTQMISRTRRRRRGRGGGEEGGGPPLPSNGNSGTKKI